MKTKVLIALACLLIPSREYVASSDDKPTANLQSLTWMVGSWVERREGVETEEYWMPPKGGLMLGLNRTVRGGRKTQFEYLRIEETPKGVTYFASPAGRAATDFRLVESSEKKAVFENRQHDFPQRIIYWLDTDGALRARIEGTVRGAKRSQEWRWEKTK